ncbi:MAG: hypothetical protein IJ770_04670 [Alphaproteobacteria bacterium]|nr:hypothetical protein [Alphaproteobacteria bacterium]
MRKKIFKVSDFRKVWGKLVELRARDSMDKSDTSFLEILNTMEQMSDEQLLQAKLYADLGMDSMSLAEMLTYMEFTCKFHISDEIYTTLGTGVTVTVQKFIDAVNAK